MNLEVGSIVQGLVTKITNYGAFVELPGGNVGLIHISEIDDSFVYDVGKFLKEKDKVKVKIIGKNDKGKFDLSIKQVFKDEKSKHGSNPRFEEMFAKFLKESEERQLDLKRNLEAKRGGGKRQ